VSPFANSSDKIRLAVVGGGALTQELYLPALQNFHEARVTLLVDDDPSRRANLVSKFDISHAHEDLQGCYDLFDAAIVTVPGAMRHLTCVSLLERSKPVLVEPPMALTAAECEDIAWVAEQNDTAIIEARSRRFLGSHSMAHFLIAGCDLGRLESFDFREGSTPAWPAASDISFYKRIAGGGALVDPGVHAIGSLLQWLGNFSEIQYHDDNAGGVEANALLELRHESGATGVVELSRTRRLRNTAIMRWERGTIEVLLDTSTYKLAFADQILSFQANNGDDGCSAQDRTSLVRAELNHFVSTIRGGGRVAASDFKLAQSTIKLIESCYRIRKPLIFSWAYQERSASSNGPV
jgi:predicted dehydrogenase